MVDKMADYKLIKAFDFKVEESLKLPAVTPSEFWKLAKINDTNWKCITKLIAGIMKYGIKASGRFWELFLEKKPEQILRKILFNYLVTGNVFIREVTEQQTIEQSIEPDLLNFKNESGLDSKRIGLEILSGEGITGEDEELITYFSGEVPKSDILTIRSLYIQENQGLPYWTPIINKLETMAYIEVYDKKYFQNLGRPDGILVLSSSSEEKEIETKIKDFFSTYKGIENRGKVMVLAAREDVEPAKAVQYIKLTEDKVETYKELYESLRYHTLAMHGVPPRLMGIITPGSLGDSKELMEQLFMYEEETLKPLRQEIREQISEILDIFGSSIEINDAPENFLAGIQGIGSII